MCLLCVQREAVWALGNVASGTSAQTRAVVACDAVPHFVVLLSHDDAAVRVLSGAPCGHASMAHTVSAPATHLPPVASVCARRDAVMCTRCHQIVEQAASALGNIVGDSPELRDVALDCGALPKFTEVR